MVAMPGTPVPDRPATTALQRLLSGSGRPQLLVAIDGSAGSTHRLVSALHEAARRDAVILVVAVVPSAAGDADRAAVQTVLAAQVLHATEQTGIRDRAVSTVVDAPLLDALTGAAAAGLVEGALAPIRPRPPAPPLRMWHPAVCCT